MRVRPSSSVVPLPAMALTGQALSAVLRGSVSKVPVSAVALTDTFYEHDKVAYPLPAVARAYTDNPVVPLYLTPTPAEIFTSTVLGIVSPVLISTLPAEVLMSSQVGDVVVTGPIQDTLTLQPGPGTAVDTFLNEQGGDVDYGASTTVLISRLVTEDRNRGLFKFDISSIPAGATIDSAVFSLYCISGSGQNPVDVNLHRAITQWFAGPGAGAPVGGADASNWLYRNRNGSVAWGAVGGQSSVDYAASSSAVESVGSGSAWYEWDITQLVQDWVDGTYTNWGFWLIGNYSSTGTRTFSAGDGFTAENRPKLVVDYTYTV